MANDETQFDYRPDSADKKLPSGSQTVSWTASEYVDHQRGLSWYALLLVITLALAAAVYLLQKDIFATGTIIAIGVIVAVAASRKPNQAVYEITPQGLKVGEKQYSYDQFKSFTIIREGQVTSLLFMPLKRLQPPVSAYFDSADEDKITEIIGQYLPYEQRTQDRIDSLSRRLRF